MNNSAPKIHSLSHLENTPQNEAAIRLATWGRGRYSFDTSWGHVVTKIIDLLAEKQLDYTTYSGENVPVFGAGEDLNSVEGIRKVKAEIMAYYGLDEDDSGRIVVDAYFQQMAGNLHNVKLKQLDKEALTARRDVIKKIIEDVVIQWEENIPVPTVLERVKNLTEKDEALAVLTPKQLEEDVLWISQCDSFWADTPEKEKMGFTMSKRELDTLLNSLTYLAIDYPDHARIERSVSQIKNRIMELVQVSQGQIQALNTKNNDIPSRKRTSIWKKVFSLDNN